MTSSDIWKWLHDVFVVGGPSVIVAYGLFKWWGQKWIEHQLGIRLEKLRSEQQKELERLRHLLSSRISKIHEKEFEVLPKAWFKLHDAHGSAFWALLRLAQYPNFRLLSDPQFEEFLKVSGLSDYQKDALRKAPDRQKYFSEAMEGIGLDDAEEKQRIFHNYLIEHRIFMTDELREKFGAVDGELSSALIEYSVGKQSEDWDMQRSAAKRVTRLKDKIDEVEEAVQKRLHYEEA